MPEWPADELLDVAAAIGLAARLIARGRLESGRGAARCVLLGLPEPDGREETQALWCALRDLAGRGGTPARRANARRQAEPERAGE